jgi:His-Xaa-Ser system protein HxsD
MKIKLNSKIYPLEVILNACYAFIDRAYIFLDSNSKAQDYYVFLKGKNRLAERQLTSLRGEFMNELLHCALRHKISKENKKIREYIIGRALYSASSSAKKGDALSKKLKDKGPDYEKDPLEITKTWEKKYGRDRQSAESKI